jgi:hypothetical protein
MIKIGASSFSFSSWPRSRSSCDVIVSRTHQTPVRFVLDSRQNSINISLGSYA